MDIFEMIEDQLKLSNLNKKIKETKKMLEDINIIGGQQEYYIKSNYTITKYGKEGYVVIFCLEPKRSIELSSSFFYEHIIKSRHSYIIDRELLLITKGDPLYNYFIKKICTQFEKSIQELEEKKNTILAKYKEEVNTDEVHNNQQES